MTTVVYTDGACSGNPGPGGWAWAVLGGAFASGHAENTTNQRMEITAAYEAVKSIAGPVEIISDSTYVINCFQKQWWQGWERNGWKNAAKKPVANRDLWEPFVNLVKTRGQEISFRWVKGHSGDPGNDLVDALAVEAGKKQEGRTGTDSTGAGPEPKKKAAPAGVPKGHLLMVTGHKPPALGGYDPNPKSEATRDKLQEIIAAKASMQSELVVLSGLALGAEQLGAEAALLAGVPLGVVLAFPGQDEAWSPALRARYKELVTAAKDEILLEATKPTSKQGAGMALGRRDDWLARNVTEALVVWDGEDPYVGRTVQSLRDYLGDDQVWVVSPA